MAPEVLADALATRKKQGKLPKAVIAVDLYGQTCDYDALCELCERHGVLLIADAAEALGATYRSRPAGSFGVCGAFSFNGNKIITTSGGGMLVSRDQRIVSEARHLSTQARDPAPHYQHSAVGYNYRMSNLLAAVGRAQLAGLDDKVRKRRRLSERYRSALSDVPGIAFLPVADYGTPNYWLTCICVDLAVAGVSREDLRLALEEAQIEARPVWKPMHLQPVFEQCESYGGDVAARLFDEGLCLPSGSTLLEQDQDRVIDMIRTILEAARRQ